MTRGFFCLLTIAVALIARPVGAQQPVKIGFVAELSGPQAALGQDMLDGFMLVVDRNGGKLGGAPVQVIKEDSQLKTEGANQIVDKLIEKDKVAIIAGVTFSNIMMAIYKKVVDAQVFLVGSNASPSPIAGAQCSPFYFQTGAQNDQRAEARGHRPPGPARRPHTAPTGPAPRWRLRRSRAADSRQPARPGATRRR